MKIQATKAAAFMLAALLPGLGRAAVPPGTPVPMYIHRFYAPTFEGPASAVLGQTVPLRFRYKDPNWSVDPDKLWYQVEFWSCAEGHVRPPQPSVFDTKNGTPKLSAPDKDGLACGAYVWGPTLVKDAGTKHSGGQTTVLPKEETSTGGVRFAKDGSGTGTDFYRARLQLKDSKMGPSQMNGPWGPWHQIKVVDKHFKDAPVPKAVFMSPHMGQVWTDQAVRIEIESKWRHQDNSKWEMQVQWQHATAPRSHKYSSSPFFIGWLNFPDPKWKNHALPAKVPELEVGGGAQIMLPFDWVRPADDKTTAWYHVRVREHYIPNGHSPFGYGPWSDWLTFGVAHNNQLPNTTAPVISGPKEDRSYQGGNNIYVQYTEPQHADAAKWSCCDIELDRAIVVEQDNQNYMQANAPPGGWKEVPMPTSQQPWHEYHLTNKANNLLNTWTVPGGQQLVPTSHKWGYRYWVRLREKYLPSGDHGPWSAWRSFVVQMPYSGGGSASGLQRGFVPGQMKPGSQTGGGFMPKSSAPATHTLSGHMPGVMTPARPGSATGHNLHVNPLPPHVRVIQQNEKVDYSCENLDRLITVHEELVNDGGPLPAGHAQIYIDEYGGARIHGAKVPVPPLAHGASVWLNMAAGTTAAHASDLPGVHHVNMTLAVDGKTISSFLTFTLDTDKCKPGVRHLVPMHPMRVNPKPVLHPLHMRTQ